MFTQRFSHITRQDVPQAGGKGASLGEMTQAGILVPPGFVVLASAFEQFIHETEIKADIEAILSKVKHQDTASIERASEEIKAIILNEDIPSDVSREIKSEFKKLGAEFVAVRSSATSEDSSSAAWAGQLETYLNTSEKELLGNVKRCWASLFTPRAIFYRFEKGLQKEFISVAVVVQKMVQSEVSGIAFSVHPVTEDYNQMIIEAGFGLGEAIVSGSITPDSYIIKKKKLELKDATISTQDKMLVKAAQGNEWKFVPMAKQSKQKLSNPEILKLAKLILKIENHYGFPCDIEWAKEESKFYITQSRPITTLNNKNQQLVQELKIENYQRLFQWVGMPFLFSDIFMGYYKSLEGLIIFHKNIWTNYIPKNIQKETLEEGLKIYDKGFRNFKQGFERYKKQLEKQFKITVRSGDKVSTKRFFKLASEFFSYYSKTEFFYTDVAYQSKNKSVKTNLKKLDKIKNSGRTFLNSVFVDNDSYLSLMVKNISNKFQVPTDTLNMYSVSEVLELFEGKKVPQKTIQNRRKAFVMSGNKDTVKFTIGNEAINLIEVFQGQTNESVKEIQGTVANKGKAIGRAKVIILDYKNFGKMSEQIKEINKGDILLAETTGPEMILACKKAGAIVTNQGGMMSHAAIVSRELGIPCIVGTGNITEMFRDGDMIEVDGYRGTIKILDNGKLVLSKIYSREKTLFYFSMWNDSDRRGWKKFLGYEVKQNLFIAPPPGRKGSVWYSSKELSDIDALLKQKLKLKTDPTLVNRFVQTLDSNWKILNPYLTDKKQIKNLKEFQNYYEHLVDWWSAMNTAFTIPDMEEVPAKIHNIFLKYRIESEKYTEKMNKVMVAFWHTHFPEYKDLTFCIAPHEVAKLEGKLAKKALAEIRARKDGCIMFNGKILPMSELETILAANNLVLEKTETETAQEIKGMPAFKGKVKGKVRRILSFADMKAFKKGEILVTEMTNPDYVPIMKIAAAVVTDEGGATCHAAIASRELKVPCIVGTKASTHLLRNGDTIELDAYRGIIKILKRKK